MICIFKSTDPLDTNTIFDYEYRYIVLDMTATYHLQDKVEQIVTGKDDDGGFFTKDVDCTVITILPSCQKVTVQMSMIEVAKLWAETMQQTLTVADQGLVDTIKAEQE